MSSLGSPSTFFLAKKKAYEVERSLRFNRPDDTKLTRTPSSAGNRQTWTWSGWIKTTTNTGENFLFSVVNSGYSGNSEYTTINLYANKLRLSQATNHIRAANNIFRDPSAWYHIVVKYDSTDSTADDRAILYVNGERLTDLSDNISISSNYETAINTNLTHTIGASGGNDQEFDGYMAEVHFLDGYAYDPSYFGETNPATGQWNPKKYGGSYGTNGFYLNFSDNSGTSATTLGKDSSGNGNNWTPNNFSVASGIEGDSFSDTPTNNFSTLNPLISSGVGTSNTITAPTLVQGNLRRNGRTKVLTSTIPLINNKYYAEYKLHDTMYGGYHQPGVYKSNASQTTSDDSAKSAYYDIGMIMIEGTQQSGGIGSYGFNSYTNADIVQIAIDTTQNPAKIWFGKNNSWENSGDPANGTNGFTLTADAEYVFYAGYGSNHVNGIEGTMFFGAHTGGFNYDPPTGFVTASTANLPNPTIKLPDKNFETLLYTGNGSNDHAITGLDFSPDWVWIKERSSTSNHTLGDTVRGANKILESNDADAESTPSTARLKSFDSNGFTNDSSGAVNENSQTYVAWNWNAGDTDGKTYTVTVVDDSGNKYRFDGFGTSAVTLDLAEGGTYIFNYPSAHPLKFSTTADGTHGGGSEYTTGVTHNSSTQVTIVVAASAPQLYYYCGSHSGMGGAVNTNSTLGSSNFDGSIQSTVKVNATAGFSIVTYTGTGADGTVGHGLGVTPDAIILKNRDRSVDWVVKHKSLTSGYINYLNLNGVPDGATGGNNGIIADLSSSSNFSITRTSNSGNYNLVGVNGEKYIAYCFSSVEGYSKFGSYTTNGASGDGPFIYLGFRPAFFLHKRTNDGSSNSDWRIWDNKREGVNINPIEIMLQPNDNDADYDSANVAMDFLSNGIKVRATDTGNNNPSGGTFIYFAFAESPFKNARAR